jgi:hypothetical protein
VPAKIVIGPGAAFAPGRKSAVAVLSLPLAAGCTTVTFTKPPTAAPFASVALNTATVLALTCPTCRVKWAVTCTTPPGITVRLFTPTVMTSGSATSKRSGPRLRPSGAVAQATGRGSWPGRGKGGRS